MNASNQTIAELQIVLDRARDDVRDAAQRRPELTGADMLKLREGAHAAWVKLESAKKAS
jgi:hypothetical protein